jgi:hypothetical protein
MKSFKKALESQFLIASEIHCVSKWYDIVVQTMNICVGCECLCSGKRCAGWHCYTWTPPTNSLRISEKICENIANCGMRNLHSATVCWCNSCLSDDTVESVMI